MVVARGSASSGGKGSGQHMPRICRSVCRPRKRVSPMTTPSASGAAHRSTTALPGDRANGSGRHTRGTHSRTVIDGSLTVRNYRCELTIAPSVSQALRFELSPVAAGGGVLFYSSSGRWSGPGEADWGETSTSVKEIIAATRRQRSPRLVSRQWVIAHRAEDVTDRDPILG